MALEEKGSAIGLISWLCVGAMLVLFWIDRSIGDAQMSLLLGLPVLGLMGVGLACFLISFGQLYTGRGDQRANWIGFAGSIVFWCTFFLLANL